MKVKYPYTAYTYTFRLEELNAQNTGAQSLDKLNSLAARLTDLLEYESVKFKGAVLVAGCGNIDDCVKLISTNCGEYSTSKPSL